MQLRALAVAAAMSLALLQGCKMSTPLQLETGDIRICDGAERVVAIVRDISASQNLSFHYGTHETDYGTQATFRLIGNGYEIVLFNLMSETNYTLDLYETSSGKGAERAAREAFSRFKISLREATKSDCN